MSSKLSERDKILLKAGGTFVPGTRKYEGGIFGNSEDNDYVLLSIIEPTTDRIILTKEIEPVTEGDRVVVKPGIDIRDMGFVSGRFNFRYEFYRRLAGSDDVVLTKTAPIGKEGDIFFYNTTGLHRGGYVNEGIRKLAIFSFTNKKSPYLKESYI